MIYWAIAEIKKYLYRQIRENLKNYMTRISVTVSMTEPL